MAEPPQAVTPDEIPAREYIFVLDVSGSMHGFPLDTAKTLMGDLVNVLRPTDTFNIIVFADGTETFSTRLRSGNAPESHARAAVHRARRTAAAERGFWPRSNARCRSRVNRRSRAASCC